MTVHYMDIQVPQDSAGWLAYFESNKQSALDMPWDMGVALTAEEKALITPSLKAFQKGEGSEGHNLLRYARAYATSANDPDYLACIDLFIKEEQKHSGFLALYLKQMNEPVLLHTWTDSVFRWLRKYLGLQWSLTVLITAEIMALSYYDAVRSVCTCPLLHKICGRIIADEQQHVLFQSQRIGRLRLRHSRLVRVFIYAAHRFLFAGTRMAVWLAYRHPYQRAGVSFIGYWRWAGSHFNACVQVMKSQAKP
jgi:hypothetical protein